MNILYVTHRYPPNTGGIETHVLELATRIADRGHDVTIFSADAGTTEPSHSSADVRIRRFRSVHPQNAFFFCPQLVTAVRGADADIVHAHNYHALPMVLARLGVSPDQFIATPHYHGASANRLRNLMLSAYRPLGRRVLQRASHVIAVSDWEQQQLKRDLGVETTVIPNGIDRSRFRDATPESRPRPFLLCVGRLEEYKGIQHVIQTLDFLDGYDLVIAGQGPYRDRLEQLAKNRGIRDRVSFLGYVDDNRLPSLYKGAAVYLTLSAFEAYGMTVGEALTAGTPCVVRETGALTDWTDIDGCVGVTDTAPETIAAAIHRATDQIVSTGAVPDWETVVDNTLKIYQTSPNNSKQRKSRRHRSERNE